MSKNDVDNGRDGKDDSDAGSDPEQSNTADAPQSDGGLRRTGDTLSVRLDLAVRKVRPSRHKRCQARSVRLQARADNQGDVR
jgi:hypothetical protein